MLSSGLLPLRRPRLCWRYRRCAEGRVGLPDRVATPPPQRKTRTETGRESYRVLSPCSASVHRNQQHRKSDTVSFRFVIRYDTWARALKSANLVINVES